MPENFATHISFPKVTDPGTCTLGEVIYNDTTTRYKMSLNRLGVTKGESVSVSIMIKIGI